MAEYALGAFFVAWLLITGFCQIPSSAQDYCRRHDPLSLIPRWHFFAPVPGMQDFTLVYRDQRSDSVITHWHEAPVPAIAPQPLCGIWNPARRHNKALLDITKDLMQLIGQELSPEQIQLSIPYLALLMHISSLPRPDKASSTQFALVMTKSSAAPEPSSVVFVSALHALN